MRLVTLAWAFGAMWMQITCGAALTRYAKVLAMPAFGFGLLAAMPYVGSLMQLPASFIMERYGRRKLFFMTAGVVHRALWLPIAAIPWVLPANLWWVALLAFMTASSVAANICSPGVMAWFGDIVPRPLRGRYFSKRMQVGQLTGLLAVLAVGYALDKAQLVSETALQWTVSGVLATAALLGVADFLVLTRVPHADIRDRNQSVSLWSVLRVPLADRNFRRFLGFSATLTFGVGYIGPYIWLYVFDVVKLNNSMANLVLVAIPLLISLLSVPFWGRMIDRFGRRPVMLIAGLFIIPGGAAWIFIRQSSWHVGYPLASGAMFAFPGLDLAALNLLLSLTTMPGSRRPNSAYLAVYAVTGALAGALSGVFGGIMARALSGWEGLFLGWPLTYHGVLFLISGALRALSLLWLIGLKDRGAHGLRDTLRQMGGDARGGARRALVVTGRATHWLTAAVSSSRLAIVSSILAPISLYRSRVRTLALARAYGVSRVSAQIPCSRPRYPAKLGDSHRDG